MAFPSDFGAFLGNRPVLDDLRAAIASRRLPHAMIFAGANGAGKYTLALMVTLALECERQPRQRDADGRELADFCGACRNCARILQSADLDDRVAEAVGAREEMREADKKETRVLVQTHPDVLIVPPDPPQLLIKLGQIRTVIAAAHYVSTEAPARVFVITSAAFMKEAANSLLKLLEEPPPRVHLILLAENPGDLLPTVRSRCALVRLGALPSEEIAALLAERRPELGPGERELIARLSEGAAGRAFGFDLAAYVAARRDAMVLLSAFDHTGDHGPLFRTTETYRAGAEGQEKTLALLGALGGLLEDVLLLQNGAPAQVRNLDVVKELSRFAENMNFAAVESALRSLDEVRAGMRRNLLRSLSLDAFALSLGSAALRSRI